MYGTGKEEIKFTYYNNNGKRTSNYQPFEGVVNNFERRYNNTDSSFVREELNKYLSKQICDACNGTRLCEAALNVFVGNKNIAEISEMPIEEVWNFSRKLN